MSCYQSDDTFAQDHVYTSEGPGIPSLTVTDYKPSHIGQAPPVQTMPPPRDANRGASVNAIGPTSSCGSVPATNPVRSLTSHGLPDFRNMKYEGLGSNLQPVFVDESLAPYRYWRGLRELPHDQYIAECVYIQAERARRGGLFPTSFKAVASSAVSASNTGTADSRRTAAKPATRVTKSNSR